MSRKWRKGGAGKNLNILPWKSANGNFKIDSFRIQTIVLGKDFCATMANASLQHKFVTGTMIVMTSVMNNTVVRFPHLNNFLYNYFSISSVMLCHIYYQYTNRYYLIFKYLKLEIMLRSH